MGKFKSKVKAKAKAKVTVKAKTKAKSIKPSKTAKKTKAVKAKVAKVKTKPAKVKKAVAKKSTPRKMATPMPIKLGKAATSPVKNIDYAKVVTPLGDRLVVRLVAVERMTAGGLFIPDSVSDVQGHLKGEVLAAGSGARTKKGHKRPLDVTVGDQIYFDQHSSIKITFGREDLHIVKEIDVLGVAK